MKVFNVLIFLNYGKLVKHLGFNPNYFVNN